MARLASGDTREKILAAAEDRLWHFGFKKTTVDEIAAAAGVGKGTVYLHFDSKEDIALAIIAHYKSESITQMRSLAETGSLSVKDKLFHLLFDPIRLAYEKCAASPAAQEMVVAVRPFVKAHIGHFLEEEIAILASVLDDGNRLGIFDVADTMSASRTLKLMCSGMWPPYSRMTDLSTLEQDTHDIVSLAITGLGKTTCEGSTSNAAAYAARGNENTHAS